MPQCNLFEIEAFLNLSFRERSVAKRKKMLRDAVTPFRDRLWVLFQEQAKGMDGGDVVIALKQAGEEIWAVGIDETYTAMKHQDDEALGNAFDITWLTEFFWGGGGGGGGKKKLNASKPNLGNGNNNRRPLWRKNSRSWTTSSTIP